MTSETPGPGDGPRQPESGAAPELQTSPAAPPPSGPATPAWATPPPPSPAGPIGPGAPPPPPTGQPGPSAPPVQPSQGWAPASGGVPPAGWAPPPQSSGNGCLKGCLIVAVIGIILVTIGFIALFAVGKSFLSGFGVTSTGTLKACPIVSTADLERVLGGDVQSSELTGLADATFGKALDRRVLPDAPNCWVGSSADTSSAFGRIAKYSGADAATVYDKARTAAQDGGYFVADLPGIGDGAFCTGWSSYPATGALVRHGNDLVYVSFIQGRGVGGDVATTDNGVSYSPSSCQDAASIAELALR